MTASSRRGLALEVPRYNPRPAGVIRDGSATQVVLAFMQRRPLWFTHRQIVQETGRSPKAVDWALLYLRAQALVECVPDAHRNPRYLRYRAVLATSASSLRKSP
jgi:hypothetical protein